MIDIVYYSIFLIISILIIQFLFSRKTTQKDLNLPPSPPSLPIIGHLHLIKTPLHVCLHKLSSKYGPILYLQFGASKKLHISSASFATEIFRTHDLTFASRPPFGIEEKLPSVASSFMNAQYGDYWKFLKKLCVTKLFSSKALEASKGIRKGELRHFLMNMMDSGSRMEAIDVGFELTKMANNTICRMIMSTRCSNKDGEAEECRKLVKESFEYGVKLSIGEILGPLKWLGFWIYGKQAIDVARRFDELVEKILQEHEANRGKESGISNDNNKDLMDVLLDAYYDDQAEYKLTRTDIKTFLLEIFIGGTESSASTSQWAIAELINHPNIFKKVREEIDSVVGNSRMVEESDIPKLPFFQAVIKEVLRLHPSGAFSTRLARNHCKIQGFDIPKNTFLLINIFSINRDPKIWDNPNEFNPERFLIYNEDKTEFIFNQEIINGQPFFSFGGGRRKCPGMPLAYSIVYCTVAAMVQCFDWKVISGNGEELAMVDMKIGKRLTHEMANPFLCIPIVRSKPF